MPVSLIFHHFLGTGKTKKSAGDFAKVQFLFTELTLISLQYCRASKLIVPDLFRSKVYWKVPAHTKQHLFPVDLKGCSVAQMAAKQYPQAVDLPTQGYTLANIYTFYLFSLYASRDRFSKCSIRDNADSPTSSVDLTRGENTFCIQVGNMLGSDISSKYRMQEKKEDIPLEMSWKN